MFISTFIICKFSTSPTIFPLLSHILQRPPENTLSFEILRVAENLSLAYMSSFIFYILINYIPDKQAKLRTEKLLSKSLTNLYLNMNMVLSYFKFSTEVEDFSKATPEQVEKIDNFSFKPHPEFLIVSATRNNEPDGEHLECFNAKNEMIAAGKEIQKTLSKINTILSNNKMDTHFIILISELENSEFLQKLCEVIPATLEIDGMENRYLNFYNSIAEFEKSEKQLEKYDFLKLNVVFRKANAKEISDCAKHISI